MKKTEVLKKNYEFRKVLNKGDFYGGQYIDVFLSKNNKNINYIGIAVGVKIAKAVKRNHVKRLIRECYRLMEDEIHSGNNIVFLWKKKRDIKDANFINIQNDMIYIFKKAGIL